MQLRCMFACLVISTMATTSVSYSCHYSREDQIVAATQKVHFLIAALEQAQTVSIAQNVTESLATQLLVLNQMCRQNPEASAIMSQAQSHIDQLALKKISILSAQAAHAPYNNHLLNHDALMIGRYANLLQLDAPLTYADTDSYYCI